MAPAYTTVHAHLWCTMLRMHSSRDAPVLLTHTCYFTAMGASCAKAQMTQLYSRPTGRLALRQHSWPISVACSNLHTMPSDMNMHAVQCSAAWKLTVTRRHTFVLAVVAAHAWIRNCGL